MSTLSTWLMPILRQWLQIHTDSAISTGPLMMKSTQVSIFSTLRTHQAIQISLEPSLVEKFSPGLMQVGPKCTDLKKATKHLAWSSTPTVKMQASGLTKKRRLHLPLLGSKLPQPLHLLASPPSWCWCERITHLLQSPIRCRPNYEERGSQLELVRSVRVRCEKAR